MGAGLTMRGRNIVANRTILAALLGAVSALVAAGPAGAVPVTGDPALYWQEVFLSVQAPTGYQRQSAAMSIALHDAVNAALDKPRRPYLQGVGARGGDVRAAAAQAAHDTLMAFQPAQAATWSAALSAQLALVADGPAKTQGIATGAAHAAAMIAERAGDGTGAPTPYMPSGLPGRWAPTPPGFGPAIQPWLGNVKPWLTTGNDQYRPAPSPALDSPEYTAAFDEVHELGAAGSATRTADQTDAALFWGAALGPTTYLQAGIELGEPLGWDTIDYARMFALLNVALADVTQAIWNSKFHYDYWRPVTAIRAADTDGNPSTLADPTWTPLLNTPPHQAYVSAHAGIAGALTPILAELLGEQPYCSVSPGPMPRTRCFTSFTQSALDSSDSRVWGGIHWRFDSEAGLELGEAIARHVMDSRAFDVPAPGALALFGLGLAGLAAGRARQRPAAQG
jgi:hypothetical protein